MRQQEFLILGGADNQWTLLAKTLEGSTYLGCFNDAAFNWYYGNPLQSVTNFNLQEGDDTVVISLDYGYWEGTVKITVDLDDYIEDSNGNKYFKIIEMGFVGTRPPSRKP